MTIFEIKIGDSGKNNGELFRPYFLYFAHIFQHGIFLDAIKELFG